MFIFILAFFLIPQNAHAYVDPGSGSFFLQMLTASLIGTFFYFRRFFSKLIFWKKKNPLTDAQTLSEK